MSHWSIWQNIALCENSVARSLLLQSQKCFLFIVYCLPNMFAWRFVFVLSVMWTITHERFWQSLRNLTQICIPVAGTSVHFLSLVTSLMTSSGLKMALITTSIFRLECRSKAQMSEILIAIFLAYSIFISIPIKKVATTSKWRSFWKCHNIKYSFNLISTMKRSSQNHTRKSIFHGDAAIYDVTWWLQRRPSIFLYRWKNNIFVITEKRTKI